MISCWELLAVDGNVEARLALPNGVVDAIAAEVRGRQRPASPTTADLPDFLPKESRGSEQSETLAIIAAIKDMQPRVQNPLEVLSQAKELFAAPTQQEKNHLAELDQILGFAQKLASLRVGGGERSGWELGLDYVRELSPSILGIINNAMMLRMGTAGMAQPAPGVPPSASGFGVFNPYDQAAMREHLRRTNMNAQAAATGAPSATPPGTQAATAAPPANAARGPAEAPDGTQGSNEILALIGQYGGLSVNALNIGASGADFADNISQLFGAGTVIVIANHGEDSLLRTMMSVPNLAMFGEGRLREFVHEFVHFEEILEAGEEIEPEPEKPKRSRTNA
jgi:hypothetical protein